MIDVSLLQFYMIWYRKSIKATEKEPLYQSKQQLL